jgi:hypothetical protein
MYPNRKLAPRWTRPGKVIRALKNGVTYEVALEGGSMTVHVSRLLPLEGEAWGEAYPEPRARRTKAKRVEPEVEEEDGDIHMESASPNHVVGKSIGIHKGVNEERVVVGEGKVGLSEGPSVCPSSAERGQDGTDAAEDQASEPGLAPAALGSVNGEAGPATGVRPAALAIADDGRPIYYVRKFHEAKFVGRRKHILVEWEGYPERAEFTWEPRVRLREDVPDLVREFERVERARRRDIGLL